MKPASFSIRAIETEVFHPGQNLCDFVVKSINPVPDGSVLAITSKIVSLAEMRIVAKESVEKTELVKSEADVYFGEIGYGCHLTIKHGLLIPSAGIDESNSENAEYILFPLDPFASLKNLHEGLCRQLGLKHLGLIMTDSHTTPLRRGVTGIALAYWGMKGTRNFIGKPDLFGRPMQMTYVNIVDALATSAVFAMGETNECCPLALIEGVEIEFTNDTDPSEVQIPLEDDLYQSFLTSSLKQRT